MHKFRLSLVCILALAFYFCGGKASILHAAQALSVGGGQARVDLQFRITIHPILFLQVGQGGSTIDTIDFNLSGLPGSGRVDGDPRGIPVRAAGLVPQGQTVTLTADSATPLSNGDNIIPFSNISWRATGDFPAGGFNDRTNQKIGQWTGSGDRTGTYSFNYRHVNYYPPGTYVGRVIYTLSTP
jgi:hypothetical protein